MLVRMIDHDAGRGRPAAPSESTRRRRLAARAHALKPLATLSPERLDDGAIAHVRQLLQAHELAKVRIDCDDRSAFEAAAAEVAVRVPCEVVQRIGRVVVLHRAPAAGAATDQPSS
jgi:RNA-binding protein YhbY